MALGKPRSDATAPEVSAKRKAESNRLLKGVSDKKSRAVVAAAVEAADVSKHWRASVEDLLVPDEETGLVAEGMERTFRFKQSDIVSAAPSGAAAGVYSLDLPLHGPYTAEYSRNGRCKCIPSRFRSYYSNCDG